MDYAQVRNDIVKGLQGFLRAPVVPTDNNAKKPKYPFLSYKFTTIYRPQGSHNITYSPVPSRDPNFEFDIEITRQEQPQIILSISTYSLDDAESCSLALNAKNWFIHHGYEFLKSKNIIVVDVTPIQDRTILIVDNYEQRMGFDVILRVTDEQKRAIEGIEILEMEGTN